VSDARHGVEPRAVIEVLRERAARAAAGDRAPDGHKVGLVVEGGGLRGVTTGGGLVALERLGYTGLFDEVYGTSAGAMNAAYFLAGQARFGIRIYYEDMVRGEIVNPLRLWKVFDIDRLFAKVITGRKPLRLEAVLTSPSRLRVALLDAATGRGVLADSRALGGADDLLTVLKAATAIPVYYNQRFDISGRACLDAGIVNPFPLEGAFADGCTHVLVLLSRPERYRLRPVTMFSRWFFDRLCARGNEALAQAYARWHEVDARLRDLAFGRAATPAGVRIATICTDPDERVDHLTTNAARLRLAAIRFGRRTLRLFDAETEEHAHESALAPAA
jgi:predicted patatin/cPLA2 family phospholipase